MKRVQSPRTRFASFALIILALAAASVFSNSRAARADEPLPSQEQALAQALVNHPDIVAAKAKVALANAELYGKRTEVSRQILGLYGNLKGLSAKIDVAKAELSKVKSDFERANQAAATGAADRATRDNADAEFRTAEAELVFVIGQREQAENELRLLIGPAAGAADAVSTETFAPGTRASQTPQGPIVDKMKTAAEKSTKLEFIETPLVTILGSLSDHAGVMFSAQRPALESEGIGLDMPISFSTGNVRLLDAIQAFEDAYPDLQFVLRDYGVLLTTRSYAQEQSYAPLLELVKGSANASKSR